MKEHFSIMNPFEPLFKPIIGIANAFLKIGELLTLLIELLAKMLASASIIFDPARLINDIIIGSIVGITNLIKNILERLRPSYFDSVLTGKKECKENNGKSSKGKYCYKPTFIYYITLLACPPLAIFMQLGLSSFFEVILCGVLTVYGYYFPGLLYAMLITQGKV